MTSINWFIRTLFYFLPFNLVQGYDMTPRCNHAFPTQEKYVSVFLNGQFGNQLFQLATAYAYSLDHGIPLTVPDLLLNLCYDIPHNAETVFLRNIACYSPHSSPFLIWKEPNFNYSPIPVSTRIQLKGFFQSEKYFSHRRKELLELFAAPEGYNERILAKYPFLSSSELVVGVQIRDYRAYTPNGEYHPTLGREYYQRAISLFPENTIFIVTSNNLAFAKECIEGLASNIIYLNADYIEEFYTLVMCKSFIISNSSFGWWAAWLSIAEGKRVIVPDPWLSPPYNNEEMTRDLFPSNYEILSVR